MSPMHVPMAQFSRPACPTRLDARGCRVTGADAPLARALEASPGFVMAHVMKVHLPMLGRDVHRVRQARAALDVALGRGGARAVRPRHRGAHTRGRPRRPRRPHRRLGAAVAAGARRRSDGHALAAAGRCVGAAHRRPLLQLQRWARMPRCSTSRPPRMRSRCSIVKSASRPASRSPWHRRRVHSTRPGHRGPPCWGDWLHDVRSRSGTPDRGSVDAWPPGRIRRAVVGATSARWPCTP